MTDIVETIAGEVGRPYGMTASEILLLAVIGNEQHPDASPTDCGRRDPRAGAERYWCTEEPGHPGDHYRYARWAARQGAWAEVWTVLDAAAALQ